MRDDVPTLTPEMLFLAYSQGAFPMADSRFGAVSWYSPDPRAILPLDSFRVSRSLRRRVASGVYRITFNRAFAQVIEACAQPRSYARDTWINEEIIEAFAGLHRLGYAHSVEAWRDEQLVGGLYGVAIGAAFFGESMFSRATDASKVCLVHLVASLRARGYVLLDVQMSNPHMEQFGVIEIPRDEYLQRLAHATALPHRGIGDGPVPG